jgi:hypothetical protein
MGSSDGRDHVDILEENLKRQIQETESLRHDVLLQKMELEKQAAALNHLISSIHAEQRHGDTSVAFAGDGLSPVSDFCDGGGSLSPIKRVPSDGDDAKSLPNSLEDSDRSEIDEQNSGDGSSGDDSDSDGRFRNRLLSIVAEVDGEDESLCEQQVLMRALRRSISLTRTLGNTVAFAHTGKCSRAPAIESN